MIFMHIFEQVYHIFDTVKGKAANEKGRIYYVQLLIKCSTNTSEIIITRLLMITDIINEN